jgi:large subunit ribosomal protein L22
MGKPKQERRLADTEAMAAGTMMRVSERKLGLVAGLIQGMPAGRAVVALEFSRKRIAKSVQKVLQSAIANAENNHNLDVDRLVVAEASVGKQVVMKRFHARGRGRSAGIQKPFSRLRIVVRERGDDAVEGAA